MVVIRRQDDEGQGSGPSPQEFEKMLQGRTNPEFVRPGEMVSGKVVSVGRDSVFVDIGCKSEGMIDAHDFLDAEGNVDVKVGDMVEATVISTRGGIQLSRSLKKNQQNLGVLEDAFENRIPVEGTVMEVRKGGFGVQLGSGTMAFCPISQIDNRYVEKPEVHIGQTYTFRITEFSAEERNVVISRRVLLDEEAKAKARETRDRIGVGSIVDGTVRKLMPFGAFVDIGGVDGLVHVSEISWDRVEDPSKVLEEGQKVKVKIIKYDKTSEKLSLSIREAGEDPWDSVQERFPIGTVMSGTVVRLESFGAFVRIASGIEGLVHISDISWVGRLRHPSEVVNVGDSVQVAVMGIDLEKKRISLGMKQVNTDPFETALTRYKPGDQATGRVQRIGAGGVFIELEEGVVAFLPGSLAGTAKGEPLSASFKVGNMVSLQVREVEAERRRITLEASTAAANEEKAEFDSYMKSSGVKAFSMGTFGELLAKSQDKKSKK